MIRFLLTLPLLFLPGFAIGDTTDDAKTGLPAGGMRRGTCAGRGDRTNCSHPGPAQQRGQGHGRGCAAARGPAGRQAGERSGRGRGHGCARVEAPGEADAAHPGPGRGRGARGPAGRGRGHGIGDGSCRPAPAAATDLSGLATAPEAFLDRLHEALKRERIAQATYAAMAERWAQPRRWSNLARAEGQHRDAVAALLRAWGEGPDLETELELPVFTTEEEASAVAIGIEQAVIELYEALLADCPDARARGVLGQIQQANRRHLEAARR